MDVYSESNFWNKVVKYAKIAGKEVIAKRASALLRQSRSELTAMG
jgi:hypothetical protein